MTYQGKQIPSQAGRRRTGRSCFDGTIQFSHQLRETPMIYSNSECPFNSASCFQIEDAALAQYRSWSGPKPSSDCNRVLVGLPTSRDSGVILPDGRYMSMPVAKTRCVGKYPSLCLTTTNDDTMISYDVVSEMYRWAGPNDGPATL